ncbi:MAG: DUF1972 domain-containing protein [Bacteroidaceae bacterium]|nr:DUF1972 domain-containing protein [Bacteroidaceae bacterium]
MKKRVAIVGIVGVPANYGGYETMVDNMLDYTPDNIEYTVYCSKTAYKERPKEYKGARLLYFPFNANGPQALFYDFLCTIHAYFHSDTILSLGNNGVLAYPFLRLFGKRRSIYNYDGFECNRDKWSTSVRILINAVQKTAARFSDANIADNDAIQPLLKERYNIDSTIIEYGGDGAYPVQNDKHLKEKYGLSPQSYYFNVARIEPENNIHLMLEAFAGLPDKQLVLVGNWHKNQYGESLLDKYKDCSNIKMFDPIYEKDEINLLRSNCKLYIHPHSVGGTNPSLVEAMYLGLPIVAFDVIYNKKTTEEEAFYFKDAQSLRTVVNDNEALFADCAQKMKEIADRRYRWKVISDKYCQLY